MARFWIVNAGYHAYHDGNGSLGEVNKVDKRWRAIKDVPGQPRRKIGDFPTWQRAREAVEAAVNRPAS